MSASASHTDYLAFLERLRARERYEPVARSRGKEKLAGILRLLEVLGHPERAFRVVHVAGTNGKGMTAAMVARLLAGAGRRVGVYCSPHLLDIRERIMLRGRPIAKQAFHAAGGTVLDAAERLERKERIDLSYFDLLTAMGFLALQREGVAWAVLEVGLGGFSDATNITDKDLCILTCIGLDHMGVLGKDLRSIAEQKLGILRPGVPTIVAPQPEELQPWLNRRAAELGGTVMAADPAPLEIIARGLGHASSEPWPRGRVPAPRMACAAAALAAAELLLGPVQGQALQARLRRALHTPVPGRLEYRENVALRRHGGPPFRKVVLDGGHNAPALQALTDQLALWGISGYSLIFGMQKDKLSQPVRKPLARLLAEAKQVITLAPATPRAPATEELHDFLAGVLMGHAAAPPLLACPGPREALLAAARHPGRPLVAAGSFWMLGDLMKQLKSAHQR
ncbi:MAG: bifunctional folylpolyglutamate synthase/ dihydrofolate synthase [SAR324 cluster bacterium]|nr:bifunctional folylpolyglutamate synthase/ dihydrofolate synthase [SAR324 cluster bacterium]